MLRLKAHVCQGARGPREPSVKQTVRVASGVAATLVLAAVGAPAAPAQERGTLERPLFMAERFQSGRSVHPVFEGWTPNPDGTFSLYFGYMNRNWAEHVDAPVGPRNFFSPGPRDRGQPTHFVPRRAKNAFRVTVPADFGTRTLVWTLALRGETNQVPGSLRPEYQVDVDRNRETGNTPPSIAPLDNRTAAVGTPLHLAAEVTDDGLPRIRERRPRRVRRGPGPPLKAPELRGLAVYWRKYRGPGAVGFAPPASGVADGRATTTATFDAPGDYILQVVADDGSGDGGAGTYHCCWTTAELAVTVTAP